MSESFDRKVAALARDHRSSSTSISLQLLDAVEKYLSHLPRAGWKKGARHLASQVHRLASAQSSMPQIGAIGKKVLEAVAGEPEEGSGPKESAVARLNELKTAIVESRQKVAGNLPSLLRVHSTVLTLSYSSEVLEGLTMAHRLGRVGLVIVSESLPGGEGVALSRELQRRGIAILLVPDTDLAGAASLADMSIVGADSVDVSGTVTSKVGSRSLAVACKENAKPFYVTCSSFKIVSGRGRTAEENPLFESTESTLVSGYVTEEGVLTPSQFRRLRFRSRARRHSRGRGA
jgi:translation initiation factor 2B subunit (eIF-2B alpha/beta/delta family)